MLATHSRKPNSGMMNLNLDLSKVEQR